jgi:hypothetical protein
MKKIAVFAVAAAAFAGACIAQSNKWDADQQDLVNCRWRPTGEALGQKLCDEFRAEVKRDKAMAEQRQQQIDQKRLAIKEAETERALRARKEEEDFALRQKIKGAEEEAEYQRVLAEREKSLAGRKRDPYTICTEDWKVDGYYKPMPCDPNRKKSPSEVEYENEQAAMKKKCGKDYQQLRVGMSLQRFDDCTEGGATFVTDTMTAGGLVETYRSRFYIINVKGDRIVSYTRRTN